MAIEITDRDKAYSALYALAAARNCSDRFTIQDVENASDNGRNQFLHPNASRRATDIGALKRGIRAGRIEQVGPEAYRLTTSGAGQCRTALKAASHAMGRSTPDG